LKSKSSGEPAALAPRSIEVALSVPSTSDNVKVLDAPGARSPPPPPAQVGPVEAHTSTVWKLGKVESRKVVKIALVSLALIASGKTLKPNAVSRPEGNKAALVKFETATVMEKVVVDPGEENKKLLNVILASSGEGPPVIDVGTMSSIVKAPEDAVTTFALAAPLHPVNAIPASASAASRDRANALVMFDSLNSQFE
jgi:hypothetical protein